MKKALYLGVAALAALAFSACQKEVGNNEPEKRMVTVTLKAEKPGGETRTAAVEGESKVSYEWTNEDKTNLKVFVVGEDENGKEKLTEVTDRVVNISSDNKVLTVTATVEEGSTLRTAVANAWTSSNKPKINPDQSPKADNYDPAADVLVAEDVPADEMTEALLNFSRPAAINKMTLKNMAAGEKVYEVTISSEQHLTGFYNGTAMEGQLTKITLSYDDLEVGTNGEFPVYFVAMPKAGHTLTVVVKSDKYVYTKTFGPVNFTVGKFSKFGVKLPAGQEVVDTDYSGDWVITGVNSGAVYAAQAYVSGNNIRAISVTLNEEDEEIVSTKVNEIKMHFEKIDEGDYAGLYTIEDASGNYLYAAGATGSSGGNYLKGSTTLGGADYYWSVNKETDGSYSVIASKSSNRNIMQFNSGSSLFSCYASASQKPVTLYPYSWVVEDDTPVVSYEFKKVSSVTSGKQYLIVGCKEGKYYVANPVPSNNTYAYLASTEVTPSNDIISLDAMTNAFTIATSGDGYSIKQSDDRYLFASGNYNTINAGTTPSSIWTITVQTDGTFNIASEGTYIQYGQGTYTTFGRYSSMQSGAVLPFLFEYQGEEPEVPTLTSIAITTAPTTTVFTVGDTFVFDGTVTATYSDNSTKDVTADVTTDGATVISSVGENKTVTVSYTENDVTVTTTYTVTVNKKNENEKTVTLTNANIVAAGEGNSGYGNWSLTDDGGNTWSAYAIKNQHSNATSGYHFLQIKKLASGTAYYIQVPQLGTKITKIKMTVSGSSKPMDGAGNTATLFFSSDNTTSAAGDGVASGTGESSVTINTSSLSLNTGYITASGAVRIWEVTVTYE